MSEENLNELEIISPSLAASVITKKELFNTFSLKDEKEKGTDPVVARIKQLIIQRVDTSPKKDSKEDRMKYLNAAQNLLESFIPVRTLSNVIELYHDINKHLQAENRMMRTLINESMNSIKIFMF
ncbi:hypothetical protein DX928_23305 [Bacillus swezeyi]|uniref:Uncharacterized protein n=1 Tax=Bacillus swezeyi TaxID=1925020 RepID=A0A5M8RED2_9BACI|nr:hypothetical protein DX927_23065 [Bacillus swezeyi]KAA6471503.1 hypothetical protein DX928_23305 [Bacillus swezeyi]